ncbi:hypothetical protein DEU56DRAFT_929856 [Suillus clintonianus]|uniref:uncharacterized protein n=1 Tax=Suillus clintonianus TaxID=1904413 RepID=UPI001B86901E|nr:uncharacterized protein DEU56DRAFT_929856 [Suillus clintonianus]KAG2118602.1 hypothetical protein DEU56DRAFT_929856 [Suillus clintonianus]
MVEGFHAEPLRGTIQNVPSEMTARNKHTNIVLFGQAGAGKSSLVNLMAGQDLASTSNDTKFSTMHWPKYPIEFDGKSHKVFDTVGLEEPHLGIPQYFDAVENAYKLIQDLERQGDIDLLLLCARASRLTSTLQSNYRLFHEFFCDKKVPTIVAIAYLENEGEEMDGWWKRNRENFSLTRRPTSMVMHASPPSKAIIHTGMKNRAPRSAPFSRSSLLTDGSKHG